MEEKPVSVSESTEPNGPEWFTPDQAAQAMFVLFVTALSAGIGWIVAGWDRALVFSFLALTGSVVSCVLITTISEALRQSRLK